MLIATVSHIGSRILSDTIMRFKKVAAFTRARESTASQQTGESSASAAAFSSTPRATIETLRRAALYLKPHRGRVALNVLFTVLALISALAFPQLTQYIVDGVNRRDTAQLLAAVIGLLLAFSLRDLFGALRTLVSNDLAQRVIFDIRRDAYHHLQKLPIKYFDKMSSGDLMTRLIEDVTDVEQLLVDGTEQAVISVATIVIVLIILFVKDPFLAIFALIPLPFVTLGSIFFTIKARERIRAKHRSLSMLNAALLDNLLGIRQIKAFGHGDYDARRFDQYAETVRQRSMRVLGLWAVYVPAMTFFTSLGTVLIWGVGGVAVLNHKISLGELVSFIFYLSMLYIPIINIHGLNTILQAARASGERLFDIFDQPDEKTSWTGHQSLKRTARGNVRYESVSFGYEPGRLVLKNVNLTVGQGQTLALVGPTGSGKSTLVSLLLGFYKTNGGRIVIDDHDIQTISLDSLRRQISIVTQEPFLFRGTVRENILYGRPDATDAELLEASHAADCHNFITELSNGYDSLVGERGLRLSAGQKQRISIARAILKNTPILILDEATANIDSATERVVQEALARLRSDRTSFVIAHRLATVRRADQIAVLQDGEIIERGTHDELIRRDGLYKTLCSEQLILI